MQDPAVKYKLGTVASIVGVTPNVLRGWERRYNNIPRPARQSGKQRLYTEQDVRLLQRVVETMRQGLSMSEAVALDRGTPPQPLQGHVYRLTSRIDTVGRPVLDLKVDGLIALLPLACLASSLNRLAQRLPKRFCEVRVWVGGRPWTSVQVPR